MAEEKTDFTEQYQALFKSTFGEDINRVLTQLHNSLVDDAEKAEGLEKGYGLLKQASGVMLALSHLKGKGVLPSTKGK